MWARYLLLQLQSHYGSEPVCAINGFAAYGKLLLLRGWCVHVCSCPALLDTASANVHSLS